MAKEWITGRNPVYETLSARRRHFFELQVTPGVEIKGRIKEILTLSEKYKIPVRNVDRQRLDSIADNHQGVALQASAYPYSDLPAILSHAAGLKEPGFFLLLDTLQDPQNLGTLLRTAEVVGVQGVFIPMHRAAAVTPAVVHASSGACEHMRIAQVNLVQAITALKERDIWVMGLEGDKSAQPIESVNLGGPLALVVGSEGFGLRDLVGKSCDVLLRLPMRGQIESLNASVAGSIALYMAFQARRAALST
jgi:23S rRNA (guanosine2251-2'-O)-methyltransferase